MNTTEPKNPKRLTRDTQHKMIAGVCAGLGEYAHIDPTVVRLVWVVLTLFTGIIPGALAYGIAAFIIPEN